MLKHCAILLLAALAPGLALAGSAGAGPAGNGSTMIGTVNSSVTQDIATLGTTLDAIEVDLSNSVDDLVPPGGGGTTYLPISRAEAIFDALRNAEGSRVSADGNVVIGVATLPDGKPVTVIVNRVTGRVTILATAT